MGAALSTWQTGVIIGENVSWQLYGLVFLSTVAVYLLARLLALVPGAQRITSPLHGWMLANRRRCTVALFVLLPILGLLMLGLSWKLWVWFAHLGLLSVLYEMPVLPRRGGRLSLRGIGGLKIFLISYVWACSTVTAVLLEADSPLLFSNDHLLLWAERFLFVLALCIPFDIRDSRQDSFAGLLTLPVWLGNRGSKWLAVSTLAVFTGIAAFHYEVSSPFFAAHAISAVLSAVVIWPVRVRFHDYYLLGVVDGQLILQPLLVWGMMAIN